MDDLLNYLKDLIHFANHSEGDQQWMALDRIQWEVNKAFYDAGKDPTMYKVGAPPPCPPCPPKP